MSEKNDGDCNDYDDGDCDQYDDCNITIMVVVILMTFYDDRWSSSECGDHFIC